MYLLNYILSFLLFIFHVLNIILKPSIISKAFSIIYIIIQYLKLLNIYGKSYVSACAACLHICTSVVDIVYNLLVNIIKNISPGAYSSIDYTLYCN